MRLAAELELARSIALEAGQRLLDEVARPSGPRGRGDKADVDVEIEAALREQLRAAFPDDAILGEELGRLRGESGRTWIIDPHDGTRDFLQGHRTSSVSIALNDNGELVLGCVYAPFPTELTTSDGRLMTWCAEGALTCNGAPVTPAPSAELCETDLVLVSTRVEGPRWEENAACVAPAQLRTCASIATRLSLAAIGEAAAALTIGHGLASWDFAGAQALLKGAGGILVDALGEPIRWRGDSAEDSAGPGYFGAASPAIARSLAARYRERFRLA